MALAETSVEGRSQRPVAKEFEISRLTVRKYVRQVGPQRKDTRPRPRPVWDAVGPRVAALLAESVQWTDGKERLTATRLHALLVAEGTSGRGHGCQGRGRGSGSGSAASVRAVDVSAGRSRRGRFL
jgi:hypothetical protein